MVFFRTYPMVLSPVSVAPLGKLRLSICSCHAWLVRTRSPTLGGATVLPGPILFSPGGGTAPSEKKARFQGRHKASRLDEPESGPERDLRESDWSFGEP